MGENILQNTRTLITVLAVCVVVIIILIVVVATTGGPAVAEKDIQSLQKRLATLEERLDSLAFSGDRIDRLRTRVDELEKITSEFGKLEADLMFRISDLEAELGMTGGKKSAKTVDQPAGPEPVGKEKRQTSKPVSSVTQAPAKAPERQRTDDAWYEVRKGDTVYSISRKHGLSVEELKAMNGLQSSKIFPGQKLKVQKAE